MNLFTFLGTVATGVSRAVGGGSTGNAGAGAECTPCAANAYAASAAQEVRQMLGPTLRERRAQEQKKLARKSGSGSAR